MTKVKELEKLIEAKNEEMYEKIGLFKKELHDLVAQLSTEIDRFYKEDIICSKILNYKELTSEEVREIMFGGADGVRIIDDEEDILDMSQAESERTVVVFVKNDYYQLKVISRYGEEWEYKAQTAVRVYKRYIDMIVYESAEEM